MLVSQIKSSTPRYAPRYAAIAITVASLFVGNVALAQTPAAKKATTTRKAQVAAPTVAPASVVLTDIVVEGLQRSDPSAVFNVLPVKIGDSFNAEKGQEVIKALYASS